MLNSFAGFACNDQQLDRNRLSMEFSHFRWFSISNCHQY
jgi:hypothetical protein